MELLRRRSRRKGGGECFSADGLEEEADQPPRSSRRVLAGHVEDRGVGDQQQHQVLTNEVRPQPAGRLGSLDERDHQVVGPGSQLLDPLVSWQGHCQQVAKPSISGFHGADLLDEAFETQPRVRCPEGALRGGHVAGHLAHQRLGYELFPTPREVPVEGADAHLRPAGDLLQRGGDAPLGEQRSSAVQDGLAVAPRIRPESLPRRRSASFRGRWVSSDHDASLAEAEGGLRKAIVEGSLHLSREPYMPTSTPPPGSLSASDLAALWQSAGGRWVLDPRASRAQFHVRHFWGAITVNGWFERISGEGTVAPDGMVSGRLLIDATSLDTTNRQRDKHLRSEDFFDVERHPDVVVTVTEAGPLAGTIVRCRGTLDAAGHEEPLEFTASVQDATAGAVTLRAEVVLDRTRFGMTWSPLGMAARQARAEVTARFVRQ